MGLCGFLCVLAVVLAVSSGSDLRLRDSLALKLLEGKDLLVETLCAEAAKALNESTGVDVALNFSALVTTSSFSKPLVVDEMVLPGDCVPINLTGIKDFEDINVVLLNLHGKYNLHSERPTFRGKATDDDVGIIKTTRVTNRATQTSRLDVFIQVPNMSTPSCSVQLALFITLFTSLFTS